MNKNILFILLLLLFLLPTTFAAGGCINPVPDRIAGKQPCVFGYSATEPRWCSYEIDPRTAPSGLVVIEISSGGRYGADRDRYINIFEGEKYIDVWVDRETKPIYIDCYDSRGVQTTDAGKGWQKGFLLQSYVISTSPTTYVVDNTPEGDMARSFDTIGAQFALLNVRFNSLVTAISDLPSDLIAELDNLEFNNNYVNIIDVYDNAHYFVGGAFFTIGLFGMLYMLIKLFSK